MSGAGAGISSAILAAVVYVLLRRWRGSGRPVRTRVVVGALLMVVSMLLGLWLLPVRSVPSSEPRSVGVVPPQRARRGHGFVISTAVFVSRCKNPVDVVMVVNGSAEYWRDQRLNFPAVGHFRLALPGSGLRDIKMGLSTRAIDAQFPIYAVARGSRLLIAHPTKVLREADTTVVSASIRQWREHLGAVVVKFRASWLKSRGLRSCYLELPAITGGLSVLAAQIARGRAFSDSRLVPGRLVIQSRQSHLTARYDRGLETGFGTTTVVVRDGAVLGDASLPGPDLSSEGYATWTCATTPPSLARSRNSATTPDVLLGPRGGVYSTGYLRQSLGSDCSSVAVIQRNDAGTWRDFVILIIGALISLGAAVIVEAALDRPAGKPSLPSRGDRPTWWLR